MPEPTIDAAIEQVVRTGGDQDALTASVRELAGLLGYVLVAKPPTVHRFFRGHWDGDAYIAACGQPDPAHQDHMGADVYCPGCLKTWDVDGYETDADPKPRDGDRVRATSGEFTGAAGTIADIDPEYTPAPVLVNLDAGQCGRPYRVAHGFQPEELEPETHPADGHDAETGGPA